MKIGILGGTFNPVHNGHINLAREAVRHLGLDRLIFMVAYISPHKEMPDGVSASDRVEMVRQAIQGQERFEVSTYEIEKKGKSYSIDTVRWLRSQSDSSAEVFFITGSDSIKDLPSWKNIDDLLLLSKFVVATRPGYPLEGVPEKALRMNIVPNALSSSDIRERIRKNLPIEGLVPDQVKDYIVAKGLYR